MYTYLDTAMQKDRQTKREMDRETEREIDTIDKEVEIWTYYVPFVKLRAAFKYPHI